MLFRTVHNKVGDNLTEVRVTLKGYTLLYKNTVFPAQAEYSYFSADFRHKIFL